MCISFLKNPDYEVIFEDKNQSSLTQKLVKDVSLSLLPALVLSPFLLHTGLVPLFLYDYISCYKVETREGDVTVTFWKLT